MTIKAMHFLSIVASERRNGNSDLIGRLCVRYALKSGVDSGEIVYLKDFDIKQCRGCLRCLVGEHHCRIDDDLYRLLEIIQEADRLLLVAPVYVLSIPGKLKMLLDRFLAIAGYLTVDRPLPAASIGVAALAEWHQFQLPLMNILLLALKRRIVESHIVYGAGPGEVLLDGSAANLSTVVGNLVNFEHQGYVSVVSKLCPVDFSSVFEHVKGDMFRCPVCLTPARLAADGYYFEAGDLNNHRWTGQRLQDHFEHWVLQTRPRFKSMLSKIVKRKAEMGL